MGRKAILLFIIMLITSAPALAQLLNNPESVEYDAARKRWLVSNWADGAIVAIDSLGVQSYFNTDLSSTLGLHIRNDTLFAASNYGIYNGLVGFDLATGVMIMYINVPAQQMLNGLTSDTSGYIYGTDYDRDHIYKFDIEHGTYSEFVSSGLDQPNGIYFDPPSNQLYVIVNLLAGQPIMTVNLDDSTLTTVIQTNVLGDGLTQDCDGNWYLSNWGTDRIYKYNYDFSEPREIFSSGHIDPADIFYCKEEYVMAVPNFNGNVLELVRMWEGAEVVGTDFSDTDLGDGDGIPEPGETIELNLSIANLHTVTIGQVAVNMFCSYPDITINNPVCTLFNIPPGEVAGSRSEPIQFEISSDADTQVVEINLELKWTSDYTPKTDTVIIKKSIGNVSLLLIDDSSDRTSIDYFRESLEYTGSLWDEWPATSYYLPDPGVQDQYGVVIWFTGDYYTDPLTIEEILTMKNYLDSGISLLLTGQGIAAQLDTVDQVFLNDYLKSQYEMQLSVNFLIPESDAQVFDVSDTISLTGTGSAANQSVLDHISPLNDGVAEFQYWNRDDFGAVSYSGSYRSLFFSFGFEGITNTTTNTPRDTIMQKVIAFLDWDNPIFCCVVRGDLDRNGELNISDLTYFVEFLFGGGPPAVCAIEGDVDGNTQTNISDLTYFVDYLFGGGPQPPPCE